MDKVSRWQPDASISNLLKRAAILADIRSFFAERNIVEVETPAMSQATVTDIHMLPFQTHLFWPGSADSVIMYMITSPEYHMKRLLAANIGSIYQMCRSFRNAEAGRYHNPEFTILEWYHPYYDMYQLMHEVDDLLQQMLNCERADVISYQEAFLRYLNVDPLSADRAQLLEVATKLNLSNTANSEEDNDVILQQLFNCGVEPHIGYKKPIFVYHFPASQSILAEQNTEDNRVAERFEVYFKGVELANGFRELTDSREQYQRFKQENYKRAHYGLPQHPIDKNLLDALQHGMPACSGVAIGIDRLVMLALGAKSLSEVLAFPVWRA